MVLSTLMVLFPPQLTEHRNSLTGMPRGLLPVLSTWQYYPVALGKYSGSSRHEYLVVPAQWSVLVEVSEDKHECKRQFPGTAVLLLLLHSFGQSKSHGLHTKSGVRTMLCACSGTVKSNSEGHGCRLAPTVQLLTLLCSVHIEARLTTNKKVHPGFCGLDI